MIRVATIDDADAIAQLWNPIIRTSVATFNSVEKSPGEIASMISARAADGHGTLVALLEGTVVAFATYGQFRGGAGYRHTAEHTIIVGPEAAGHGIGRALMEALCSHARDAGMHSLWAGISAENTAGIAFHARVGFDPVATLPQVGRKFDRWFDLVLMQRML